MRRVVVSGMGIVSSIGNTTQEVVASLREAKSGISEAEDYKTMGFRCHVHGAPRSISTRWWIAARAGSWATAQPTISSRWNRRCAIPASKKKTSSTSAPA